MNGQGDQKALAMYEPECKITHDHSVTGVHGDYRKNKVENSDNSRKY